MKTASLADCCGAIVAAWRPTGLVLVAGLAALAACATAYQDQVAATCQGIASDVAYEDCERRVARSLSDQRLDYIVRSQVGQR
jgi:hypothetical protein